MEAKHRGQIYLYGERHCNQKIMEKQLEIWHDFYHNDNLRCLFLEHCYFATEFFNMWMRSSGDDILEMLYEIALAPNFPYIKDFFRTIKKNCPETIFCGTTPAYPPIGEKYLQYLEDSNQIDSDKYCQAKKSMEKGKRLYAEYGGEWDDGYREANIVENFICKFEKLNGESVMGIYGAMHIMLDPVEYFDDVPCLGHQLKERYGEAVHFEDLSYLFDGKNIILSPQDENIQEKDITHSLDKANKKYGKVLKRLGENRN